MLRHLHGDGRDLFAVFTDHLLDNVGEVIILRFPDDVQQCLHHGPNEGGDVLFGCRRGRQTGHVVTEEIKHVG